MKEAKERTELVGHLLYESIVFTLNLKPYLLYYVSIQMFIYLLLKLEKVHFC